MGSELGYAYDFHLRMLEEDEITSKYKSKRKDGVKTFLFEFTTNFILKKRSQDVEEEESSSSDVIIDSERFDTYMYPNVDDQKMDFHLLLWDVDLRLMQYWMNGDEIIFLLNETLDFTRNIASDPQHVLLNLIPVAVCIEVRTVQQDGETLDDAMDRAIRAEYTVPMFTDPTYMCYSRSSFLRELSKVRVANVEEGLALMPVCPICSRSCTLGAQISTLPKCGHTFHSHCIFLWIKDKGLICPSCPSPAYERIWEWL
ncbi:hypothetical protein CASFOL_024734 [Castilleja foliolosa]|uniref:RING-type domain-containing protein n=1 Tax=Castilleja foliolosa TaxID=1961234 RepID=A0ABD3CST6_9LAMI